VAYFVGAPFWLVGGYAGWVMGQTLLETNLVSQGWLGWWTVYINQYFTKEYQLASCHVKAIFPIRNV
jgi:putative AlgH/UPF0301 family transcriptional regulator